MNLCSRGHAEICYEEKICPLCLVQVEYIVLEKETKSLQERLNIALKELEKV